MCTTIIIVVTIIIIVTLLCYKMNCVAMYFELIDSNTVQYGVPSDGKRGQNNDTTKGSYIVVLLSVCI